MIQIQLFDPAYQYDVHALVKAFYPEEDVQFTEEYDADFPVITIGFAEEKFLLTWADPKRSVTKETPDLSGIDAAERKRFLARALYTLLSEISGRSLPWGTLTGIRPTKIAMKLLEEGRSEEEIAAHMRDTYFTSAEKISLSVKIAGLERSILTHLHGTDGYSLYVGIPFCPTRCMYCSFTSYPLDAFSDLVDTYLDRLEQEMALTAELFSDKVLDTVYIGGGTPTTLSPHQMRRLDEMLRKYFDFSSVAEYTMEAGRPDSISEEKLLAMKEAGIGRISVNPQTMHEDTLKLIGRKHSVRQVIEAFHLARESGFDNINMDLILGLPGEDEEMVAETFSKIAELGPDSLTVHSMAIKRAAAMQTFLKAHPEIKSVNTQEMMDLGAACAKKMGMKPYYLYRQKNMAGNFENVGYAKEGKYGLYNILIMEEVQSIAAIGAGTISKKVEENGLITRYANPKDVHLYLSQIEEILKKKRIFYTDQ